ncbi:MAG: hypothetical protein ACRDAJ_03060 [Serratia fonticola]
MFLLIMSAETPYSRLMICKSLLRAAFKILFTNNVVAHFGGIDDGNRDDLRKISNVITDKPDAPAKF